MKNRSFLPVILIIALVFFLPRALLAEPWESGLPAALDTLTANYWQPAVKIVFGSFTYGYTDLPSPFSSFAEEKVAKAVAAARTIHFFNRDAILAMDPAFKQIYGDAFKNGGADALLVGRFFDEGQSVRIHLELTGLSDGLLIGAIDYGIPKASLPDGLAVAPERTACETKAALQDILAAPAAGAALSVAVTTSRGGNAVYREGELLSVFVKANKRAYLKVYHIDTKGKTQLIWPNKFGGGDGLLEPGNLVSIPGERDAFSFRMEAPFGTEFIKVVASTKPFALIEPDFEDAGETARQYISRGLAPRDDEAAGNGGAESAEALTSYLILPGAD